MPKLSIIIPVYGVENYIERCCVSVFEQSYQDFEVIFVNDCTKDRSEEIVHEVIERYTHAGIHTTVIRHPVNKGISAARETGLNAATGEYVLYIDSDDYIAPDMLELLVNRAIETSADIVYCDFHEVKNGRQIHVSQSLQVSDPLLITAAMLRQEIVWCPWNKLFRRSIALEHDIHWPPGINMGEDLVVITQLFYHAKKIEHINQPLYFYNRDNVNSYLNLWNLASCRQNMQAVTAVNNFLMHQPAHQILYDALLQTKLMARYQMLYAFDDQLLSMVIDTYPDTNGSVFSYKNTPFYWKIALYLVVKKQSALSWLALRIIWRLKKLRTLASA
ncbi:MAG: glycosyltransferase family 2 protein [Pseudomonadota bacterium]